MFCIPPGSYLILLAVADQCALEDAILYCESRGIQVAVFDEPDPVEEGGEPMGKTAACTQPIPGELRKYFRKFKMWK